VGLLPLALMASVMGSPSSADAQAMIRGQITVLERQGERTTDLANAVVFLAPIDGAARGGSPVTVPIAMETRQFVPRIRVVPVGSTIEFPNHDPFRHNVFSKSGPNEFDLGLYNRGQSRGATLRREGVFPIFCNIHARMVAFAVAVSTPYFAQAGADGRFEIAGVPPGRYRLHAWHDRAGTRDRTITVSAQGMAGVTVELDARGYKVVQHRNKFGQEYTTTGRDRY
jgi:plastocyanin